VLRSRLALAVLSIVAVEAPGRASTSEARRDRAPGCGATDRVASDPLTALRQSDLALSNALHRRVPDWSPEAEVNAARVTRLLAEILDYEAIARRALGPHWDALRPTQRVEFISLFTPLTNTALVSAAERQVSLTYDSETISGDEATVVVIPRLVGGGGRAVERIEYKLGVECGRWRIHDVVVDGVSLVDGYRAQFDRLFRRETFDEVLALMRRKLKGRTASP
jgi:phospholipid transport system substrate-binding protein